MAVEMSAQEEVSSEIMVNQVMAAQREPGTTGEMRVIDEESLDPEFMRLVEVFSGNEHINACIQCGTCSGSCAFSYKMQHTPRKLMAMIRAGMREEVLESDTFWYCTSCYYCSVRCPRGINLTEVMYALRHLTVGKRKNHEAAAFYDCFNSVLRSYGRLYESGLLVRLALKTDPMSLVAYGPLGVKMFLKGKLNLLPERVRALDDIRKLYDLVGELEEETV
ncbi:MAG: 4Fe-4S dicluster domain-containing protein [Desulfitobacteriaceae bacterium]|nr:4Fe-4S dicluster domain-containing protein [Desulfitobacteriaceae bacterium]MDI6913379.1 4Fe-4S dicluster domain-containing protein [Desulfitobacteriaceae bacterium]